MVNCSLTISSVFIFSKEQHLHATCQFVVVASSSGVAGDTLAPYRADPDLVVSWEMVEQVHLISQGGSSDNKAVRCGSRRAEPLSCPICLFPPTAGWFLDALEST